MSIKPFKISVSQNTITDLKQRLANARFPDGLENARWKYGTDLDYLKELVYY